MPCAHVAPFFTSRLPFRRFLWPPPLSLDPCAAEQTRAKPSLRVTLGGAEEKFEFLVGLNGRNTSQRSIREQSLSSWVLTDEIIRQPFQNCIRQPVDKKKYFPIELTINKKFLTAIN
jgi:hypothetical protein